MSEFLSFVEDELQIFALSFLGLVYFLKILWLFRFRSSKELTFPAGNSGLGVMSSMMNIAMPWKMESVRKKPLFYIQFAVFHIGITAAIVSTFIIPYWPDILKISWIVLSLQTIIGLAVVIGLIRLIRRISNPHMRIISTIDDYVSMVLVNLFLVAGFFAVPNRFDVREWPLAVFFILTAFLLMYVPFSKISHYLYYPFTRFFLGRTMGHRGVLFKQKRSL